jgi:hypothetical protein
MNEKTEVMTLRVTEQTRSWIELIARKSGQSKSATLEKIVTDRISTIQCCARGPWSCDHVWCDLCGGWAGDTGGLHPDSEYGEMTFNCGHPQGSSRWPGVTIPEDKKIRDCDADPFQVRRFRDFVESAR